MRTGWLAGLSCVSACTTYAAGRLATTDGAVWVTHSDDGAGSADPRVSFIPAAEFPTGATRPIWPDIEASRARTLELLICKQVG